MKKKDGEDVQNDEPCIAEYRRPPIGLARPAVDEMRLDHQEHGDAAQPVEILTPRSHGSARVRHRGRYTPSETVNEVSNWRSWRIECQTEQYLSRES